MQARPGRFSTEQEGLDATRLDSTQPGSARDADAEWQRLRTKPAAFGFNPTVRS